MADVIVPLGGWGSQGWSDSAWGEGSVSVVATGTVGTVVVVTNVAFNVTGGFIDDVPFTGKVIPGNLVKNIRIGKRVAVELIYTKNGVKSKNNAVGILKVVN